MVTPLKTFMGFLVHLNVQLIFYNLPNSQWWQDNSKIAYTVVPGTKQLSASDYQIKNVKVSKADSTSTDQAGYEEVDPTITVNNSVQAGDYIDFRLGIPYKDANGQTQYEPYDTNLAKTFTLNNVGTVYNMGTYYRLVFNDEFTTLNQPQFDLQLRWGSTNQTASVNAGKIYVYQTTTDPTKDHTTFDYTPQNDVNISGQSLTSGFTVKGQYIYTAQPIGVGNQQIGAGAIPSTVRTWNNAGQVSINTNWTNTQMASLSTNDLGDEFDIRTTITKDPAGLVSYTFTTADGMKTAIQNAIATTDTQSLSEGVVGDGQSYVKVNTTKGTKPDVNVAVTMTTTTDPNNPNQETAIWHVKLTSADPTAIVFTGSVPTVIASASNFTMPTDITSYSQDLAASVNAKNYNGAKTSNTALLNDLENLPVALTQFVAYQNGKVTDQSGKFGGQWSATIVNAGTKTVDGGGSASDLVTVTMNFKDQDTNSVLKHVTYQGATGTTVKFTDAQNTYNSLTGYHFVKAVSVKDGQETALTNFDPTNISSYNFGSASKNNATQIIVYVAKDAVKQTQTATLNFIDDETHESIHRAITTQGDSGSEINFDDVATIVSGLESKGYVLADVTDDTPQATALMMLLQATATGRQIARNDVTDWSTVFGKFDDDTNVAQSFSIHFKHGTEPTSQSATAKETIEYKYEDGTQVQQNSVQNITYTRTGTTDKVTNHTSWGDWTTDDSFKNVTSPTIDGYTAEPAMVTAPTVDTSELSAATPVEFKEHVVYKANAQTATITYIDDTTGQTLKTEPADGKFGDEINFKDNVADQIKKYTDNGYELVSNSFNNNKKYQSDNSKNIFEVHLKHTFTPISETKKVTETIHYVYANGKKAAEDVQGTPVTFTRTGQHDNVTKTDGQWGAWQSDKDSFVTVTSPIIAGYTPDKTTIPSITVTVGNDDYGLDDNGVTAVTVNGNNTAPASVVRTVTYSGDEQKLTYTVIDDDNHSEKLVNGDLLANGKSDETIPSSVNTAYQAKIKNYLGKGYALVSEDTLPEKFDNNSKVNQNVVVHLKHILTPVTDTKTIHETIHYVYADGSKAADDVQGTPVTFTRTGQYDEVTNTDQWDAWQSDNDSFTAVTSPTITGYTPDLTEVGPITVKPTDQDVVKTVTYNADGQKAEISYIDDTTGTTITIAQASGKFDAAIVFSTSPVDQISELENKGYVLISNSFSNNKYQSDNSKNTFEVHFKHGVKNVSQNSTVKRTINYVYADGKQASDPVTQTLNFTEKGVQDLVTNKTTWEVAAPQNFAAVKSPVINGYTASKTTVDPVTVKFGDHDITDTVTYTKTEQPTSQPTVQPTEQPTSQPTVQPTEQPTSQPTVQPTEQPTSQPTVQPTEQPISQPTTQPMEQPIVQPTKQPNAKASTNVQWTTSSDSVNIIDKQQQSQTATAKALPQTGDSKETTSLLGLGIVSLLTMVGLLKKRRDH